MRKTPGEVHPGAVVEDGEAAEEDGEEEDGRTGHGEEEDPQGVEEALQELGEGVLEAEDHQVRPIVLREVCAMFSSHFDFTKKETA